MLSVTSGSYYFVFPHVEGTMMALRTVIIAGALLWDDDPTQTNTQLSNRVKLLIFLIRKNA